VRVERAVGYESLLEKQRAMHEYNTMIIAYPFGSCL
jgi:hypothetical protein